MSDLPFTAVVEAGRFVFLSRQASVDAAGVIIPGTFATTRTCRSTTLSTASTYRIRRRCVPR